MVRNKGFELIVGSSVDRQFGPVILFGSGGVLVEVFQDRALALPPLNRTLARRMMERTRIYRALLGVRGERAVDIAELEALLVRFSQIVVDFSDIAEIDINPLLAGPDGMIALDARVVLATPGESPRPAIMPYPNQYIESIALADGTPLLLRPIRAEDEPLIVAFHTGHSEETLRMRFFGLVRVLSRDSLIRLCHLDYDREMALVALSPSGNDSTLAGVSRYYLRCETGEAEFAVVIGDAWHGRGLGSLLMQRLIAIARERGVRRLVGEVLAENRPMLGLMSKLNFRVERTVDAQVVQVVLDL
jgi:acetyltransferase